jgi:translation initiation factor IF-2
MASKKIGVVEHYYDNIGVAVLKLTSGGLAIGDKIKFLDASGKELFEQEVVSLQIEGADVKEVKKGDDFGMKVDKKVKEGFEVHKE